MKEKVTREMTADEALMGRLLVHLLLLMQFNTHAVTEATDKWDTQPRDFDNRTRGVAHGQSTIHTIYLGTGYSSVMSTQACSRPSASSTTAATTTCTNTSPATPSW